MLIFNSFINFFILNFCCCHIIMLIYVWPILDFQVVGIDYLVYKRLKKYWVWLRHVWRHIENFPPKFFLIFLSTWIDHYKFPISLFNREFSVAWRCLMISQYLLTLPLGHLFLVITLLCKRHRLNAVEFAVGWTLGWVFFSGRLQTWPCPGFVVLGRGMWEVPPVPS